MKAISTLSWIIFATVRSEIWIANAFHVLDIPLGMKNSNRSPKSTTTTRLHAKQFASISESGDFKGPRPTGSLGKPARPKKNVNQSPSSRRKMSKQERQRTANGTMDSSSGSQVEPPDRQGVQVLRGNRGNKSVTIVRGMTGTTIPDKKMILKRLKSRLGVGGTLVDGVLEIQGGTHVEKVVDLLKNMGYVKARAI